MKWWCDKILNTVNIFKELRREKCHFLQTDGQQFKELALIAFNINNCQGEKSQEKTFSIKAFCMEEEDICFSCLEII